MNTSLKVSLIIFVFLLLILTGCVGNNNPVGVSDSVSIKVTSPSSNDTIGYKNTRVLYSVVQSNAITHLQVFINGTMVKDLVPSAAALPEVYLQLDSSLIGSRISLYLVYYENNGWASSDTVKNLYVAYTHEPPSTPYNFTFRTLSETSINLSWKDSSGGETGYEIFRRTASEDYSSMPYLVASPGNYNINDETIIPGTIYYYKIRGVNVLGKSQFCTEINTLNSGGSASVPAPSDLVVNPLTSKSVKLTWKDNSSNENYFGIERRYSFGEFQSIAVVQRNVTEYTDTKGLSAGIEYYYRVKAYSGADSSWSGEVSVIVPSYTLKAPNIISLTNPGSRKVVIKWKDNDSYGGEFHIYRKSGSDQEFSRIAELPAYQAEYEDVSVVPGKTYIYKILTTDGTYSSEFSGELSITTVIVPVAAPEITLAYYGGSNKIVLSWNVSQDVDKFIIERTDVSVTPAVVTTFEVSGSLRTYTDRTDACNKTFQYRVRAVDEFTASAFSEAAGVDGGCW